MNVCCDAIFGKNRGKLCKPEIVKIDEPQEGSSDAGPLPDYSRKNFVAGKTLPN
jgi:hypothetical protein